jgi:hypothetical protein
MMRQPVDRVLYPLGRRPSICAVHQRAQGGQPARLRPRSGWGLPSRRSHLRRWWSLTPPFHPYRQSSPAAVCSLWHFPACHHGSPLATTLPCGARTFLGLRRGRPAVSPSGPPGARTLNPRIKSPLLGQLSLRPAHFLPRRRISLRRRSTNHVLTKNPHCRPRSPPCWPGKPTSGRLCWRSRSSSPPTGSSSSTTAG